MTWDKALFAKWVRENRERLDLSQERAAARIDVTKNTWTSWEGGSAAAPRIENVFALQELFGEPCPVLVLSFGNGPTRMYSKRPQRKAAKTRVGRVVPHQKQQALDLTDKKPRRISKVGTAAVLVA